MNEARGYWNVLHNRNFLALWLAQILSLLALNSSLFVTMVLVERATQSSAQNAGLIAAVSLPAVLLAAVAGVAVDRISKKKILVGTNALRVFSQLLLTLIAIWGLEKRIDTLALITAIYVFSFFNSAVGQFFGPAEGASIPLVVTREDLFAANSLFTLTMIATQVVAIIVIVPLTIKMLGVIGALILLAVFYAGAALLLSRLPRDPIPVRPSLDARSLAKRAWREIAEGWSFSLKQPQILFGILQISLVTALVFAMATIAPGFASRVLGFAPEDAVLVFSPAGLGVLLASALVVRYGQRLSRYALPIAGTILMGASFFALGLTGHLGSPLTIWVAGIASFFAGIAMALIMIPAQTAVQEAATDEIRGRVYTVQFTLSNALGLPPLLTIGSLADIFGIANVTLGMGICLLVIALLDLRFTRRLSQRHGQNLIAQALPLPGSETMSVNTTENRAP